MRHRAILAIGALIVPLLVAAPMLYSPAIAQTPGPVATSGTATASPQPSPSGESDLGVAITVSNVAPPVGSDFDVVASVVNNGPQAATRTEVILNFGPGIGYRTASSTDPTDSCTLQTYSDPPPPSSGPEPASYPYYEGAQVTCALGELAPGATATITLGFRRTAAQASPIGAGIYSDMADPNYENNYSNVDLEPDRSNPAEVSILMTGPARAKVGTTFHLLITAKNAGPATADGATILGDMPGGMELVSIEGPSCTVTGSGSSSEPVRPDPYNSFQSFRCDVGSMAAGSTRAVDVTVKRTLPDDLYANAYIQVSNYQENNENDYTYYTLGPDTSDPADVSLSMSAPASPAVDSNFDYTIVVANVGPNTARDVVVTDMLPEGVRFGSVQAPAGTCSSTQGQTEPGPEPKPMPADGAPQDSTSPPSYYNQEVRCVFPSIASGDRARIVISVTRISPWDQWNSAWVTTATYDPDKEDNYASASINADPSVTSDIRVTMTGPPATPLVGEGFDHTFEVINQGPADATDLYLDSYLPEGVRLVSVAPSDPSVSCDNAAYGTDPVAPSDGTTSGGGGSAGAQEGSTQTSTAPYPGYSIDYVSCRLDSLAAGASRSVTVSAKRTKAFALWLSSSVYSRNFDPAYENNFAELQITPDKSNPADLRVRLDDVGKPAMDERFKITGRISNDGPSHADEVSAMISLPSGAEFVDATIDGGSCELSYGYPVHATDEGSAGSSTGTTEPQPADSPPPPSEDRPYYGYGSLVCSVARLDAGSGADFTVTAIRRSPYEDWVSAWVSAANFDPDNSNDQAGVAIEGKPYPGQCYYDSPPEQMQEQNPDCDGGTVCGTKGSDSIVVGDCPVASGAGSDDVKMEAGASSGGSTVKSGRGNDNVLIDITGVSQERRRFEIHAGSGSDNITINVAPGAGDATVVVFGERGNDTVTVDSALAGSRLRIIVRGGGGRDDIRVPGLTRGAPGIRIEAGGGADTVFGGPGPDAVFGGTGRDLLDGRAGDDTVDGGSDPDRCRGGPGRDRVTAC